MKNNLKIAGTSLLTVVAALVSAPAVAQITTFNFVNPSGNSSTVGAPGNSLTFYNNTNTIKVTVTAWSINSPTASPTEVPVAAYLGWYDKGLGVTNVTSNGSGGWTSTETNPNGHTIDNVGKYDFIALKFSQVSNNAPLPIQLRYGVLSAFDVTNDGTNNPDNDPSVSFTLDKVNANITWTTPVLDDLKLHTTELPGQMGNGTFNGVTAQYLTNLNPGMNTGNIWTIGADRLMAINTERNDGFKLTSISVQIATPEPASWAMMIGGFGIAGTSLRRRRSKQTVAALA